MEFILKEHIIQSHLNYIRKLSDKYDVDKLNEFIYIISPRKSKKASLPKRVGLTLMGLTHGDEIIGIHILNQLLMDLMFDRVTLQFPIGIALGNIEGFFSDKRFVDKDLNRSFCSKEKGSYEEKRAVELSTLLENSCWFLDFHQTKVSCLEPFFIFPYTKKGLAFAQAIHPSLSVVTHWGKSFSKDGCCTDEFVNLNGGVGISIETGQKGFDISQLNLGRIVLENTFRFLEHCLQFENETNFVVNKSKNKLYTWADIVSYPKEGSLSLDLEWKNFMSIKKGQKVGVHYSNSLCANVGGKMLFPKYPEPSLSKKMMPSELYRVIKEIQIEDLPKN